MAHTLRIWTTKYGPWEEGADERERLGADHEDIEIEPEEGQTLVEAVYAELSSRGITDYSSSNFGGTHGWYSDPDGYEHPYDGTYEDYSAHLEGFTEAEAQAVYDRTVLRKQPPAEEVRMLDDAQARVAAAHWASPGSDGSAIASLATTGHISQHTEDQLLSNLRQHPVEGTLERRELQELLNYVRVTGVRSGVTTWSTIWDAEYEDAQRPGATLVRVDERNRQTGVFNFATPDDALRVLHRTHSYSASHALQYEGYELFDGNGNSLNDQFILRDYGTSRPGPGRWTRKEYDYLAGALSRLPEHDRLGNYFARDLGVSGYFDEDRFVQAANTEGYEGNRNNATPRFSRAKRAYLADMVVHYPGDKQALGLQLADSLRGLDPKFDREKFLATAGCQENPVSHTPVVDRDDTPSYDAMQRAFNIARREHGLPETTPEELFGHQTSEDAPRDAVQPSTERTPMSTDTGMAGGEVIDLSSSIQSAENLQSSLGTYGPSLENFEGGLRANKVDGPPVEKLAQIRDLLTAAEAAAGELVSELKTRQAPAEMLTAVEGSPGDTEWLMGRGGA